jgi:hypothetical protein
MRLWRRINGTDDGLAPNRHPNRAAQHADVFTRRDVRDAGDGRFRGSRRGYQH